MKPSKEDILKTFWMFNNKGLLRDDLCFDPEHFIETVILEHWDDFDIETKTFKNRKFKEFLTEHPKFDCDSFAEGIINIDGKYYIQEDFEMCYGGEDDEDCQDVYGSKLYDVENSKEYRVDGLFIDGEEDWKKEINSNNGNTWKDMNPYCNEYAAKFYKEKIEEFKKFNDISE